jgi:uncharacterized membrane protein YdbT with pleckstrin-like domain
MAKKGGSAKILLNFIAWLTGIIVSLSVGFAMIDNILSLPSYLGGASVAMVAGWIVIITTVVSLVLAIVNHFR